MPQIRVAAPLCDVGPSVACGVSLVVAAAKLRCYEFHEAALQAKSEDISFDARHDEWDALLDSFQLVRSSDMDGGTLFLAGQFESAVEFVSDVKASMGHFGSDVQLLSMRPPSLVTVTDLDPESVDRLADEAGFQLPYDWIMRFKALQKKHLPPPVIGEGGHTGARSEAMPVEYALPDYAVPARPRCQCGNHACDDSGECNACKRDRAVRAAEDLAEHLSKRTRVSGDGGDSPALLRV